MTQLTVPTLQPAVLKQFLWRGVFCKDMVQHAAQEGLDLAQLSRVKVPPGGPTVHAAVAAAAVNNSARSVWSPSS